MGTINRFKRMAKKLLNGEMSAPIIITRNVGEVVDPSTGEVLQDIKTFNTTAVRMSIKDYLVDGTIIKAGDVQFYVYYEDRCNLVEILPTDTLTFNGDSYIVRDVKPWDFNGHLLGFNVRARVGTS